MRLESRPSFGNIMPIPEGRDLMEITAQERLRLITGYSFRVVDERHPNLWAVDLARTDPRLEKMGPGWVLDKLGDLSVVTVGAYGSWGALAGALMAREVEVGDRESLHVFEQFGSKRSQVDNFDLVNGLLAKVEIEAEKKSCDFVSVTVDRAWIRALGMIGWLDATNRFGLGREGWLVNQRFVAKDLRVLSERPEKFKDGVRFW